MSLDELRQKIDEADAKIVELIAERTNISKAIGAEKKKSGQKVVDSSREESVLEKVRMMARKKKLNDKDMENIYKQIFLLSRNVQGTSVAFQGEAGAYSEEAAIKFFGASVNAIPFETLDGVFDAMQKGEVPTGIIPVENSLEGTVARSWDLMLNSSLKVSGEKELRVSHCLIAFPEASLASIKKVYSHPQALGQSQAFLRHLNAELVPTYDTAGSVKMIKEKNIRDGAAVASARAAEIYGMKTLARGIEDNPNNYTRFFVLSNEDSPCTGKDKTSIVFSVKHKPGGLFAVLKAFATDNINLTKIESRPTRQKAWEYNFYVDFEGHRDDEAVKQMLDKIEKHTLFLKVLGSYPKGT